MKPKDVQTHMNLPLGRVPHLIGLLSLMNKSYAENSDLDFSVVECFSGKSHVALVPAVKWFEFANR